MTKQPKGSHRKLVAKDGWQTNKETGRVTVTLKPGRAFEPNRAPLLAVHIRTFPTTDEARKAVMAAKPCNCDRCAMGSRGRK